MAVEISAKMLAVAISNPGGPEVLQIVDLPEPVPAAGEVLATVRAAGINFADTHATEDSYLSKQTLPLIPGGEVVVRAAASG